WLRGALAPPAVPEKYLATAAGRGTPRTAVPRQRDDRAFMLLAELRRTGAGANTEKRVFPPLLNGPRFTAGKHYVGIRMSDEAKARPFQAGEGLVKLGDGGIDRRQRRSLDWLLGREQ